MFPRFNGKLSLQFFLFSFALFYAFGNHLYRLSMFQRFPEIFYGGIRFLYRHLDSLDGRSIIIGLTSGGNRMGDFFNVVVGQ